MFCWRMVDMMKGIEKSGYCDIGSFMSRLLQCSNELMNSGYV